MPFIAVGTRSSSRSRRPSQGARGAAGPCLQCTHRTSPATHRKPTAMNTTKRNAQPAALATATQSRLSALALASVMTAAMLLGVNGLATSEATPAQLAHHQVQQQA